MLKFIIRSADICLLLWHEKLIKYMMLSCAFFSLSRGKTTHQVKLSYFGSRKAALDSFCEHPNICRKKTLLCDNFLQNRNGLFSKGDASVKAVLYSGYSRGANE